MLFTIQDTAQLNFKPEPYKSNNPTLAQINPNAIRSPG